MPSSRPVLAVVFLLCAVPLWWCLDAQQTAAAPNLAEEVEKLTKRVEGFPSTGQVPQQFLFFGILNQDLPAQGTDEVLRAKLQALAAKLGVNTLDTSTGPTSNRLLHLRAAEAVQKEAFVAALAAASKDPARLRVLALPTPEAASVPPPAGDATAFRNLLRRKGYTPEQLGLKNLDEAVPEFNNRSSRLYYPSRLFALEQGLPPAWQVPTTEKAAGAQIQVGQQPALSGLHQALYSAALMPYRLERLTLPWAADRSCLEPEVSPQAQGLAWAAARSASKYLERPFMATLLVDPRYQTPAALRRAFYQALGQGAKMFHFAGATLPGQNGGPGLPADHPLWQTIYELIRETGAIEKYAYVDQPRPANIAFLYSSAEEILGHPQSMVEELKALWVATRRAGYAVDVLSEEDVQRGRAKEYVAMCLVGNHLERKTALALRDWVKNGGALGGYAGGGFIDEFGQPMDVLHEVFGITAAEMKHPGEIRPLKSGPQADPLDELKIETHGVIKGRTLPVLAAQLKFSPKPRASVRARYRDGSPAIILHLYGEGRAHLYGTYVATAWASQAVPKAPWKPGNSLVHPNHFVPHDFDYEMGDAVTAVSDEALFHVVTDNLDVETILMQGPTGLVLVCINWSPLPQTPFLTVQFAGPNFAKATSLASGPLKVSKLRDPNNPRAVTYNFKVKVGIADVVLIEQ